eukprot:CAMPEP_0171339060 /NCGR_PEP_ID=MMETSP0878-20121228/7717_1 /TAXON_ID=67004 /ORGANISM="Thalassiosira weissflogii, Strain CCMP1336" /LENGTH=314 /DNA_ID=CAMNT_0011840921 /DNA_START=161 /DNA_END=1105 /DNA_ORIENTATION=-
MSSSTQSIQIVGESQIVVHHDGLTIRECIGNVASSSHGDRDALSLALVSISQPASEPWLTIQYDEYLHVTDGKIHIHHFENSADREEILTVSAGQTVLIRKGTRFRPVFPVGNTKYIPLCLPAFSPERCRREDDASDEGIRNVVDNLQSLHERPGNDNSNHSNSGSGSGKIDNAKYDDIRKIYHMCQKSLWEESASKSRAYFPPTFHKDGKFTHATAVPERLIQTANHFYTDTTGDWICLELNRWELEKTCGIVTVFEEAMPVGERETGRDWSDWVCPHVYGGIPTHLTGIVTNIFDMKRSEDGKFLSIEGLAE